MKELHVEDSSLEAQIQALDNQYAKTEELLQTIESLKIEKRKELSHQKLREWQKKIGQQLGIKLSEDDHSFGLKLNNQVWLGIWDGYNSPDHLPYWGFELDSFRRDSNPDLVEQIENLLKNVGIEHVHRENKEWIAWCTTEKGVERYIALYNGAKEMGLL